MPPARTPLVELLADPTARRFDLCRRCGKVGNAQVNVRGDDRLARRDPLKGEPWRRTVTENDVRAFIHRDRLIRELAIEPAQPIGVVAAQSDVSKVHPPIMLRAPTS